jgi:hypothetical protein
VYGNGESLVRRRVYSDALKVLLDRAGLLQISYFSVVEMTPPPPAAAERCEL